MITMIFFFKCFSYGKFKEDGGKIFFHDCEFVRKSQTIKLGHVSGIPVDTILGQEKKCNPILEDM